VAEGRSREASRDAGISIVTCGARRALPVWKDQSVNKLTATPDRVAVLEPFRTVRRRRGAAA
jgi:hypothetical protein